jgi:hypothetical protein
MRSWRHAPSAENAKTAREAVATLRATTTGHLDHEEAALEPFYLEHAHTPEMKAMGRAFGRDNKLPEAGAYFAWLQDGASSDELAGLRQTCPDRWSRSSAESSAASTAAPSPRRGEEGEPLKSRSSRVSHSGPLGNGGTDGGIREVERPGGAGADKAAGVLTAVSYSVTASAR